MLLADWNSEKLIYYMADNGTAYITVRVYKKY